MKPRKATAQDMVDCFFDLVVLPTVLVLGVSALFRRKKGSR